MSSSYIVVPFQRRGATLSIRQMLQFPIAAAAEAVANQLACEVPGVAVLERRFDPDTGAEDDRLVAAFGAVPNGFPAKWAVRLN